jgi:hypothetical protein
MPLTLGNRLGPYEILAPIGAGGMGGQYELTFSLWLERAECELLSGNFENAEQLIVELLQRGASIVDQAAAYNLKVLLRTVKSAHRRGRRSNGITPGRCCLSPPAVR